MIVDLRGRDDFIRASFIEQLLQAAAHRFRRADGGAAGALVDRSQLGVAAVIFDTIDGRRKLAGPAPDQAQELQLRGRE